MKRGLLLAAALLFAVLPGRAADYVLAYVNGGTTYYLARNGTTGVQRVTTFNPATCIWSCASNTAGTTAGTLNDNNTYGYLYQTVNGTRYFLNASENALGLGTNAAANNYYRWRTNGTYVYNRYSNNTSYYINLANGVARNTTANTASNARPYEVNTSTEESTSTPPTINGADVLTATGNSTYTASGAAYRIGYTNYNFNSANHYFDANGNSFTGTPANANITYSWSLTDNAYATVNNSGVVTVSSLPEYDITLTLTVTATATGGTPAAPANTTLTASKEITIQGTKPSAPIISVSGTSVTMSTTATGTTTIRYTLDGTDPTATTGTVYGGAIDLSSSTTSPITIKAVTVRNGNASDVTTGTATLTLPEPVITVDGSAGTATIACDITGTTIYYTTNGTDPTTSSSPQYSGTISGLSPMTTIKAIAVKTGWNNSPVASETVTIPSGADGGTVTLFDYEDHNWTYYSGTDIGTYNTDYAGKLYSPNPRNVKITYDGNGGEVSIDESETEFVYYKTLEQGSTSGQYPYTVISNPFSKRPNGKGFGGWKIVSGGTYIQGHSNDDVLELDEEITFVNLPYPSVNCTSAEIEFEATWVNLNNIVRRTQTGDYTYSTTGGTYETNILVIQRSQTGTITTSSPVTIMMVEPDGSADYRTNYTFSGNITPNNNGVTKIEFTKWQSTNTVTAGYRSLWIGRGVAATGNNTCATLINGGNTTSTASPQFHIKVESGRYDYMSLLTGYYTNSGGNGGSGFTITGTATNEKVTLGNDYDRAKGTNTNLQFAYGITMGRAGSFSDRGNRDNKHTLDFNIKSGRIGYTFFMEETNTANYLQGGAGYCVYLSSGGNQTNVGTRNVLIEGGDICTVGSGVDSYNNAPSNNNTPSTTTNYNRLAFNVRIKGGTIHGNVYGGAAQSPSGGNRVMVMTGGQVKGWFAAGCNGTGSDGGQNYGTSWVYIGGKAKVDSEGSTKVLGYANGGNVYAAGAGRQGTTTCGEMTFGSNLVIADESYIERGIYGGGNYGYSLVNTKIYITGGINEGNDGTVNNVTTKGGIYGGANQQNGPAINMYMTGGEMRGGVYGGCNSSGTISSNITMQINGGQVGTTSQPANIHGGGYGSDTRVSQNVEITLGTTTQTTPGVTVYGDVYGGSALGYVNGTAATNTYHTYVTLNKGIINGSLYGGGLGDGSTAANVYGPVQVKVYGGSVRKTDANGANGSGGVYGANNVNGAPQRSVTVDIYGTDPAPSANEYALFAVYGGGNKADYTYGNGYPKVTVHNCDNSIEYVYGGGNAADVAATDVKIYGGNTIGTVFGGGNGTVTAANVTGNASTNIYGGTIGHVFGGSNSQGTIGGTISVNVNKQADTDPDGSSTACDMKIYELYGGGNKANSNVGSITIGCTGDLTAGHSEHPENIGTTLEGIGYVYGGANQANINGDITLTMNSGIVGNLFGGNNTSGTVSGGIQVDVEKDNNASCASDWYVGNVFGGGNLAQYAIPSGKSLAVNILNGTVSGNVYGGGKGDPNDHTKGQVTGDPVVTIGDNSNSHQVTVSGSVFGGGDAGNVVGTPEVNVVEKCNTVITTAVYGGGNAADVSATNVTINGGTIGDVFGGGNGAVAAANVTGATSLTIHGGTITRVFAGGNTAGTIGTNSGVTINHTSSCDQSIDEVYGGGNLAEGNAGTVTIECTAENIGDVYGGANQANVTNDITLNITGGQIDNVFGGNNTSGSISGGITVNINKSTSCNTFSVNNVYGGGNLAQYTIPNNKALAVNILNGTVSQNVYGGGKGLDSDHSKGQVTGNPVVTIGDAARLNNNGIVAAVTGDVYGGGDAGNVVGTPQVNVINKCNTTIGNVYGGGNAADVSGTDVNIDGGIISGMVFGGGHGDKNANKAANVNGNVAVDVTGGTINKVFGGSNSKGNISGTVAVNIDKGTNSCDMNITEVYGGGNEAAGNAGTITIGCTGSASEGIGDVYGGANAADINSDITLNITGGKIANVFGGNNTSGAINGGIEVNINWNGSCAQNSIQNVYGAGNLAQYTIPNNKALAVNILNGTVSQNVYGGGKGDPADHTKGQVTGNPVVTIGDAARLNNNGVVAAVTGDVYGGGDAGNVVGTPQVNVINKCNTTIGGDVYGGGNAADVTGTDVNIDGGTISGMVFGGGHGDLTTNPQKEANVGNGGVSVDITGGTISKVFGGSNSKGNITGTVAVNIDKGTNSCEMHITEVYGGGNQAAGNAGSITIGCTGGATEGIGDVYGGAREANINSDITLNITGGKITNVFGGNNISGAINGGIEVNIEWDGSCAQNSIQNVYGGGNLAQYTIPNNKALAVNVLNGTVSQNVYGGGKGLATDHTKGQVTGNPVVTIGDNTSGHASYVAVVTGDVYGGGDAGDVEGTPQVNVVNKCNTTIGNVYGGGNAADVSGTDVNIDGGNISGMVFGGGHGDNTSNPQKEANVDGNVTVDVTGGTINKVFGGSNSKGNITGTVAVNVNKGANSCEMHITEVYGGGNEAEGNAGTITIECTGDYENHGEGITNVYGGANAADVGNSITLTIKGGHIDNVYGGNNTSGSISGSVTVNVNWDDALTCGKYLGNVFGGGNLAALDGAASVNIVNGTVSHNVYGGGNEAGVGSAAISMTGGSVLEGLYGGCNTSGTVGGAISVSLTGGTIGTSGNRADVFGGGLGSSTATSGNIGVTLNGTTVYGDLYGGSALGSVNASTSHTTTLTISSNTLHGTIYGGGKGDNSTKALSNGNVQINYNAANTSLTGLYGGANINGNVKGDISLNVLANVGANGSNVDVFGGGLGAATQTEGNVTVTIGDKEGTYQPTIYGDIYGGSALGNVNSDANDLTKVDFLNGTLHGDVYGGGLGNSTHAAAVNGKVQVNIGASDQSDANCHITLTGCTVFGCNNANGSPQSDVNVNIYRTGHDATNAVPTAPATGWTSTALESVYTGGAQTYAIKAVYGGGNLADYDPTGNNTATVHVYNCANTIQTVYGGGNAADSKNVAVTIDGGLFDRVFGGGNGYSATGNHSNPAGTDYNPGANVIGTATTVIHGGYYRQVFGGSNQYGDIGTISLTFDKQATCGGLLLESFGGANEADISGNVSTTLACSESPFEIGTFYGGSNLADITGSVTLNVYGGSYTNVFGGSKGRAADQANNITAKAANISQDVTLNLLGGSMTNAFGGSDVNGNIGGKITVNMLDKEDTDCPLVVNNVYGGGRDAAYTPTTPGAYPEVNLIHGTVSTYVEGGVTKGGNIFGGGYGATATVNSNPMVNVGYQTSMSALASTLKGSALATSTVAVQNNVYGGGELANVAGSPTITIQQVPSGVTASTTVSGDVYGGGALANTTGSTVTLNGGTVTHDVYGGGLGDGTHPAAVTGAVQVTVNGGSVRDVFGCNNVNGAPTSTVRVDINSNVGRNVYGGGNAAPASVSPTVYINKGIVAGNVYGGGLGSTATLTGAPSVTVGDLTVGNESNVAQVNGDVYGGGDAAGVTGTTTVLIQKCNTVINGDVYGGGNAADVNGTDVNIDGGNITGMVFGGGHGNKNADPQTEANVAGDVTVSVTGGTINKVFGGSNSKGNIGGTVAVNIDKGATSCPMHINEVYGGGNEAAGNAGTITIGCTGTEANGEGIGDVYGGANAANINSDITLNINGGRINNVFGGNNTSGTISGAIEVNIEKTQNCDWYVGNVYDGGNLAPYTGSPAVNVKNGTVSLNVYGGGKGAGAVVTGDPVVMVGDLTPAHSAYVAAVTGDVYGGGDAAAVTGTTSVTLQKANSTAGRLFGGGNAAGVSSTATVTLTAGTVSTGVYGGCNAEGTVGGNITVALNGGTVGIDGTTTDVVYGGGYGHNTATGGDVNVTLNGATVYGSLYGGSALGSVNGSTSNTTTVTLSTNGLNGSVFGGGMGSGTTGSTQATTLGNTVVNINIYSPNLTGIYGGANVNGDVAGDINVNVEANVGTDASHTLSVYGGGFGQYTTTGGNVTVTVGNNSSTPTIYGDLYGGSALGEVGASGKIAKVDFKAGTLNGSIYGGGMGDNSTAAAVSGGTEVAVAAGTITKSIYGGCNVNGSVTEDITVNVTGGTLGASGNGNEASVYGGGFGHSTATAGNVTVNINGAQATIWGDVYGGSGFGNVNSDNNDATTVNILNGTVKGNVFGGGLGDKASLGAGHYDYAATEYGTVTVNIGATDGASTPTYSGSATIGGKVYGCNNTNGSPRENVVVNIYQTAHTTSPVDNTYETGDAYAIADVFGGGKNADFSVSGKTATVNVYTCANTIGRVFGGGDAAAVYGSVVNIYGGRFNYVFGGGNGEVVNTQADVGAGGITLNLHGGNIGTLVSGSNQRGTISGPIQVQVDNNSPCSEEVTDFFGGSNQVDIATDVTATIDCGAGVFHNVYGGSNAANITGNVTLNIKGGTMTNVFGGSKGVLSGTAANITGNVTLNLYGGTIVNAFGGSDQNGNITGNIAVNVLDHEGTCKLDVTNVYGAGNVTPYTPTIASAISPVVNVMHVKVVEDDPNTNEDESIPGIRGSVFGGGLGNTAVVTAQPRVNIGYTSAMSSLPTVQYPDASINRDTYTAIVCGSLYGGGDAAAVTGNPVVTVDNSSSMVKERIIGGGNAADVTGNTHVIVYDGTFGTGTVAGTSRGVYGGCNTTGTVSGNAVVDVFGGTFGTQAAINITDSYNIHGGGFGAATRVNGNVTVNYGVDNGTANVYPKLYGDIYGGSALGHVNTENGSNTTTVNVLNGSFGYYEEMLGGEIVNGERVGGYLNQHGGNVYGGGLGQVAAPAADEIQDDPDTPENEYRPAHPALSDIAAKVYGVVTVNIGAVTPSNDTIGNVTLARCNVYGCNNANGSPQKDVYVNIYRTGHTTQNEADYIPGLDDKVTQLFAIRNVYGGGNQADFNPDDSPSSKLVHIKVWNCYNTIENIYGGGNAAAVTGTNVFVEGGRYNYIFAGGNGQITAANVLGDAEMTIHSGRVGWYFEGCNMQGSVSGTVTVHAGHQETEPEWPCGELKVENYYFGANMATVYDGKVSLVECGGESQFDYRNVYAGSRLATIYGDIELTVRGGTIGNLYGGSEGSDFISADVKRYPVDAADIANFPAEHQAGLTAYLTAHPEKYGKGGNIILRLEGGEIENVFGGCNYRGNVEGNIYIIVDSIAGSCPLDIDYLYGGSKLAAYTPRDTTGVNHYSPKIELKNGHVNYDVFGGSRGGDSTHPWGNGIMTANPQVIVGHKTTGTFRIGRDLYGGGSAGDVNGDTEIKIDGHLDGSSNPTTNIIGNVFGGGKSGNVSGNSSVTILPE